MTKENNMIFHELQGKKKLQYIWDYYKLPIIVVCTIICIMISSIYGHFTKKEIVCYTALINVSIGDTLTKQLTDDFLDDQQRNKKRNDFFLYSNLYLTDDETSEYFELTNTSQLKIIATINSKQLDIVLMDKEVFDSFSQNGYLYDLEKLLSEKDSNLLKKIKPYLQSNTEILEDNSEELAQGITDTYISKTTSYMMGIDLSEAPIIKAAGFSDKVYFGIIKNTPRTDIAVEYLDYLFSN